MKKQTILLYDDDEKINQKYAKSLLEIPEVIKEFKVQALSNDSFKEEISILEQRRASNRTGKEVNTQSRLDDAAILIIDYDLLKNPKNDYLTGENVAYLTRCYSRCLFIIGVNQFGPPGANFFDLTLAAHLESYCDLNVSSAHLCNPVLWGKRKSNFRPWYWPELNKCVENAEKRIADVESHINEPIINILELDTSLPLFSRAKIGYLGDDSEKITFKEFALKSGKGLKLKDINLDDGMLARIAAARLAVWLENSVLLAEDILVDAPHLVSRYPSLLTGSHDKINSWNKTTQFKPVDKLGINSEAIERYRYKKDFWLSRPVWHWQEVCKDSGIKEVAEPWKRENPKFLFCEDSSTFRERKSCTEFRAEIDSVYVQRFVNLPLIEGVDYQPRVRLM